MNNLDADSLIKAGRRVKEPFCLMLDGESPELFITRVFRLLPGKRIVALARHGDREVLVKVFLGRFAKRYARRERRGAEAVAEAGVPTPALHWQKRLKSGGGEVIAFDYLHDAKNLTEAWQTAETEEQKLTLLLSVLSVLARLHAGGVAQNDIHPENFLIHSELIYTIDGGDVTGKSRPLTEKESLDNLALFFAQFQARYDQQLPTTLRFYEESRGWSHDSERLGGLVEAVIRKRDQRKVDHLDKAFRDCTRFACERSLSRYTVFERAFDSEEMRRFLANLDQAIDDGQILKNGNTATVALVESPRGPLVVKRYNIKNFLHGLSRLFRKSRAWISWANSHRLEFLGIKTVSPVALVEERYGPLRSRAYFVTEYIDGPDASMLDERRDDQLHSIAELLKNLSQAGVTHGDLKASNFLLSEEGAVIIDLDSMKEHVDHRQRTQAEKKDLERFMKNWESNPSIERKFTDLLR